MPGKINTNYVNPERTFSYLSRAWKEQLGSKAGKNDAAADSGRTLLVEQANRGQKPTKHGDGKLPELKDGVQINIAEVRAAIDHEYQDLKVGDQKLSDFVLSCLKNHDGVMTLSSDTLELLNDRVTEGFVKAVCRDEIAQLARGLAANRVAGSGVGARVEAAETNHIESNWNKLASGYQIMRHAIAADLKDIAGFMNDRDREAAFGPDALTSGDDFFLNKADDVIARAGVTTTGLTNGAVDGIRECLLTTPQYNVNLGKAGEGPRYPEFEATQALYGKVVMGDSVNANSIRLTEATKNAEALLDAKYGGYEQKKSAIKKLKNLFKNSAELAHKTEENQKAVLDDNDPQGSVSKPSRKSIADRFRELAIEIYNSIADLFQSSDVGKAADDGGIGYENHKLAEQLASVANLNYSYAKSLTPEDEKPVGIAALTPVYNKESALTDDWARNEMGRGGLLGVELKSADVIYQDPDFAAREINSGHGDPVESYNKKIAEVRRAYSDYLHDEGPETLSNLSKAIDGAMASGNRLRGHMKKHTPEMLAELAPSLKRMDNNTVHKTLDTQASLLDKLSLAVDIEFNRLANNGVADNQGGASNMGNSDSAYKTLLDLGLINVDEDAPDIDINTAPTDASNVLLEEQADVDDDVKQSMPAQTSQTIDDYSGDDEVIAEIGKETPAGPLETP